MPFLERHAGCKNNLNGHPLVLLSPALFAQLPRNMTQFTGNMALERDRKIWPAEVKSCQSWITANLLDLPYP